MNENINTTPIIPEEYRPLSPWAYFGYQLLFNIPCVGFILLCIFALGGTKNINLKNYARSYFIVYLLVFIITVLIIAIFGVGALSFEIFKTR